MRKVLTILVLSTAVAAAQHLAPLGPLLERCYPLMSGQDTAIIWVYFTDKGIAAEQKMAVAPSAYLSERAIQRRQRALQTSQVIDMADVPLEQSYVDQIKGMVTTFRHEVKWFNSVSAIATKEQIDLIRTLPIVREVDAVGRYRRAPNDIEETPAGPPQPSTEGLRPLLNYGPSLAQIQQIHVDTVHNLGINGQGVLVGIFDAGVSYPTHPALVTRPVLAHYDFVANRDSLGWYSHGENTFSVVGGYSEGNLIGPAYGATFVLARTEDAATETPIEEDNWARAIIWADSIGIDVSSTSLGYGDPTDPYDPPWPSWSWQDMNGSTTVITRAADRAFQMGIAVVNSAGNAGDDPSHNTLGAPADGFYVITAGALTSSGGRVSFSSVGPTADGRIKPDIMALGSGVWAATGASSYGGVSGTSFSCPLSAGVAALVVGGNPGVTSFQVREAMRQTASQAATPDRLNGWGTLNALRAVNYVWITHTPLTNTEDTTARTILVSLRSRIPMVAESTAVVYGIGGTFTGTALLSPTNPPGTYSAQIPYLGSGVNVTYYIKAVNGSNSVRLPLDAPTGYFSYQVGRDQTGPTIVHSDLGNQGITSWPPLISAQVSDMSGVGTVRVEFSRNGAAQPPFNLALDNGMYSDTLHLARSQVGPGDTISYRIVATDNAGQPNTSTYPASGMIRFAVKNFANVNLPFESTGGGLSGTNDWQWGTPSGPSPQAHGGAKCWGTILGGDYSTGPLLSSLTTATYAVFSNHASFTFWHWYEMQSRFDGGNVKVSINGGPFQVIQPVDSFPNASIYSGFGNPLGGQPGYSNTSGSLWTKATFHLTGIAAEGNTIAIRFDFGADNSIQYRGWYIDDFASDGFGTSLDGVASHDGMPGTYVLQQNYPNPFNPSTTIAYQIASPGHVLLKVYDVLGREVATLVNETQPAGAFEATWDARNAASGLYFYRLEAGTFSDVKRMLLLK